ncbi:preprotein translocase subunit SecG [Capnocytophaga canimorsus]|uniref:preprotein translocase subunit SecG n=1 Tax=Capnocytophaga canimorsus TaxID=28188 RepID=UPI0037CCCE69
MTAFNIFLVLIIVVCLLLMLVIMVQNPKGGGLSSTFGSNTQVVGGVKKTGDFLDRSTWTFAILLVVLIIAANTFVDTGRETNSGSRLLDGKKIENVAPESNPLEAPTTQKDTAQ